GQGGPGRPERVNWGGNHLRIKQPSHRRQKDKNRMGEAEGARQGKNKDMLDNQTGIAVASGGWCPASWKRATWG
ncbi:MAG: hypothetical protein JRN29_01920, partial [Nitrososphaerota archaeon]|nr:hypothetical protein [Nitrososphaerota archaeon]